MSEQSIPKGPIGYTRDGGTISVGLPSGDAPTNTFTDDEVKQLEAAYRRVAVVEGQDGGYSYVFKRAERLHWRAFRASASDEDKRADAQEVLVKQCIVAVAYDGRKALDVEGARKLWDEMIADYTSAADGREVSKLVFQVNGEAGARQGK